MRTHAHFSLAQAQDQIAETCDTRRDGAGAAARYRDRAWAHVVEANERWFLLERADGAYDARKYARLVDRLIRGYPDAAALAAIQNPDATAGKQFVFFVGTPRCGSTLAERVVLASGAALPLGEIGTFPRMLRHLAGDLGAPASEAGGMFDAGRDVAAYLERLLALPRDKAIKHVRKVADQYMETTSALCSLEHSNLADGGKYRGMSASGEVLYVDKQLDNHVHVAMIRAAMPAATIVWCARDARDVGLSQRRAAPLFLSPFLSFPPSRVRSPGSSTPSRRSTTRAPTTTATRSPASRTTTRRTRGSSASRQSRGS